MGQEVAEMIARSVPIDAETVEGYAQSFEDLGADEIVWFPRSDDLEQVDLLAEAAGDRLGEGAAARR
jgi:hypothetical protein